MPSRRHNRQTGPIYRAIRYPLSASRNRSRGPTPTRPRSRLATLAPRAVFFYLLAGPHPRSRLATLAPRAVFLLNSPPLRRPATVVRDRRDVADRLHVDADRLQRAHGRLAAGARAGDADFERP